MRAPVFWLAVALGCGIAARADGIARVAAVAPADATDTAAPADLTQAPVYICPMDPDVRSHQAGACRRCGMNLVAGVPDPVEFHVDVSTIPAAPQPGLAVIQFEVDDPWKDRPVHSFNPVHERLFHAFVVSQDLQFFVHGHPSLVADGVFQYPIVLPKAGMYRVLADFYPAGATPQLSSGTVFVRGEPPSPVALRRDYVPKDGPNLHVSLSTVPDAPVATARTQLRFVVEGEHPLEKYLGAWGHMLVASSDVIEMMHEHPFLADGSRNVEFEVVFARPGIYRVWVQFQSHGVVNTAHFDVPVVESP